MIHAEPQPLDPSRPGGPFTRWPRVADACLAFVVFLAAVYLADEPDGGLTLRGPGAVLEWEVLLAGAASGALYWRRSRPLAVLTVVIVASALAVGFGSMDISGIAVIAVYSVGRYVVLDLRAYTAGAAGAALIVITGMINGYPADEIWAGLFATLLALFIGTRIRVRRMWAVQTERERVSQMREAAAEERTRIARELHDVVAHHVSLITVQAGAARTVAADDPEAALRAMETVEREGRQVLRELRDLLDVLRPETFDEEVGPQPTLSQIPRLVERLRAAGMHIDLGIEGSGVELPARVDLFSYRIVQEALTNVLKHAGSHARTEVNVRVGAESVDIEVVDDGLGRVTPSGAGHGLIGMKERARLLGGTVEAAPRADGGFSVIARLPIDQATT